MSLIQGAGEGAGSTRGAAPSPIRKAMARVTPPAVASATTGASQGRFLKFARPAKSPDESVADGTFGSF
jgi:hypothetical protein